MIYLLYGDDTYRSRIKLREIVASYQAKQGPDALVHWFDAEEKDLADLKQICETQSLFSKKKLVIAQRLFSAHKPLTVLNDMLARVSGSSETVLMLWDVALDAEAKKQLATAANLLDKTQECTTLNSAQIKRWIVQQAGQRGLTLTVSQRLSVETLGSDCWAIANTLDKIALYPAGSGRAFSLSAPVSLFALGDAFFTQPKRALSMLQTLLESGQDAFGLMTYLANHNRTLLIVKIFEARRQPIPALYRIHPYVAKKAGGVTRLLSLQQMQASLRRFFEADWRAKTGLAAPADALADMLLSAQK